MPSFTPKQLGPEELKQKEEQFQQEVFGNPEEMEKVFHNLHDFFKDNSPNTDYKYYNSHFRWYTEVSWKRLRSRDKDFITNIAVPRQIFLATLLGYDITDKLLSYLKTKCVDENETQSLYNDIQQGFENSSAIIYLDEETTMTVSDLISKFRAIRKKDDYSLEQAKLYTQIRDKVSETDWFEYKFIEFEEVLERLEEFTVFIEEADIDNIFYIVDAYFFPERYERYTEEGEVAEEVINEEEGATLDRVEVESEPEQPSDSEESEGTTGEEKTVEPNKKKNTEKQKVDDILQEELESETKQEKAQQTRQTEVKEEKKSDQKKTQQEAKQTEKKEEVKPEQETATDTKKPEEAKEGQEAEKKDIEKEKEGLSEQQTKKTESNEKQKVSEETRSVQDILEEEASQTEQETTTSEEQTTEQEKIQPKQKRENTKEEPKKDKAEQKKVNSEESAKKDQKTEQEEEKDLSSHAKQAQQNIKEHKGMSDKEIKDEVESQFGPIKNLDPTSIDSFRRVLKNIARQEDREDEVSDWFYFDQESGKFKWNI